MRYRKKLKNWLHLPGPVDIEAFQMTEDHRWDNSEWPEWLNEAWNKEPSEDGVLYCVDGGEPLYIGTLEGVMAVN